MVTEPSCQPQTLIGADGATLTCCAHGGHVLGWTPAGGSQRLWLSPTTGCGPGVAIRGGIPVIFPQFAGRGPLPKHGFARNRGWQVTSTPLAGDLGSDAHTSVCWQARLTADAQTLSIWPYRFELLLTARAAGDQLETTLSISNPGDVEWSFTAALHAYLALGDPSALIHGLGGRTAQDNADAGRPTTVGTPGSPIAAVDTRDVAFIDAGQPLRLADPLLGDLLISADGFEDRVVWNPGPGAGLTDVPDGAQRAFVCIEPAALTPVMLPPRTSWSGTLRLRAAAR